MIIIHIVNFILIFTLKLIHTSPNSNTYHQTTNNQIENLRVIQSGYSFATLSWQLEGALLEGSLTQLCLLEKLHNQQLNCLSIDWKVNLISFTSLQQNQTYSAKIRTVINGVNSQWKYVNISTSSLSTSIQKINRDTMYTRSDEIYVNYRFEKRIALSSIILSIRTVNGSETICEQLVKYECESRQGEIRSSKMCSDTSSIRVDVTMDLDRSGSEVHILLDNLNDLYGYGMFGELRSEENVFEIDEPHMQLSADVRTFQCNRECYYRESKNYTGFYSKTKSGIVCQRWDRNNPHEVYRTYKFYHPPNNFCLKHPADHAKYYRPWCYTTNPKRRWENCSVPECTSSHGECLRIFEVKVEDQSVMVKWHDITQNELNVLYFVSNRNCYVIYPADTQNIDRLNNSTHSMNERFSQCINREHHKFITHELNRQYLHAKIYNLTAGVYNVILIIFNETFIPQITVNKSVLIKPMKRNFVIKIIDLLYEKKELSSIGVIVGVMVSMVIVLCVIFFVLIRIRYFGVNGGGTKVNNMIVVFKRWFKSMSDERSDRFH